MKKYARILDAHVVLFECYLDDAPAPSRPPYAYIEVPATSSVQIGDTWNGTTFSPDRTWWIDIGPFFDRFGAYKHPILASVDTTVQAIVKDCQVRKYIDLQGRSADIGTALDILVSKGFAIDKTAILTTVPTDAERHK